MLQAHHRIAAQIERAAVGPAGSRGQQERVHRIVHVGEIAKLLPLPHLEQFALQQQPDPDAQKGLACVFHAHARPIRVGQTKRARRNPENIVVQDVIPLARHFVDAVHIHRAQQVILVHREIIRFSVDLPRAGENHFDPWIALPAGFQNRNLRAAVDLQVGIRIVHGIHMAGLSSQVEQVVLIRHQVTHAVGVPHVRDIHPHAVLDPRDVKGIAAVLRHQAVEQRHFSAQAGQPAR